MKFVILKPEQNGCTKALWKEVFSEDTDAFVNTYYDDKGSCNTIFSMLEDGEPVSMIHWNPRTVSFKGQLLQTRFLVAVATKDAYRRQGLMAKLLTEGFRYYYKQKLPFLFLTPADEQYYTPFGFVTVAEKKEFNVQTYMGQSREKFLGKPDSEEKMNFAHYQLKEIPESSYATLAQLANKTYNKSSDLFVWRDEEYYRTLNRELQSEEGAIMGVYDEDTLVGSFVFTSDGGMYLRDFIGTVPMEHEAMAQFLTEETLIHQQEQTMIRLLHLPSFVAMLRTEQTEIYYVTITDGHIPENNGSYVLKIGPEASEIWSCPEKQLSLCEKVTEAEFVKRYIKNVKMTEFV